MDRNNKQKNKGFTLVELMVAIFVFTSIMVVAMGSMLTALSTVKEARALRFAMDNVGFATESMTRTIRMGTSYLCKEGEPEINLSNPNMGTQDCPNGGTLLALKPQGSSGSYIAYKQHAKDDDSYDLERCDDSGTCVSIVSPDVKITKLRFYVNGSDSNDGIQASVYVVMKGEVTVRGVETKFSLQTMASQRNY
jgi:prepilin-type N-terminal cleavage/methylation domain-containing protein